MDGGHASRSMEPQYQCVEQQISHSRNHHMPERGRGERPAQIGQAKGGCKNGKISGRDKGIERLEGQALENSKLSGRDLT
jgi:hypothetical protein